MHVVLVHNSTDTAAYVNGIYKPGGYSSGSHELPPDTTANLRIGTWYTTGREWNGSMDEIRIYSRALSPAEIKASYNAEANNYTTSFTNLSEGGTYTYRAYIVDEAGLVNKSLERQFTVNNKPTISNVILNATSANNYSTDNLTVWFTQADSDSDAVTNITDWRKDGTSYALLNMPLDTNDSTTVRDYTTWEDNGTNNGAVWQSDGMVGGALNFETDGYVEIFPSQLELDSAHATIMFWFKLNNVSQGYQKFISGTTGGSFSFFGIYNARPRAEADTNSVYWYSITNDIDNNTWYHIAAIAENGTVKTYMNGVLESTITPTDNLSIRWLSHASSSQMNGTLDEILIYNYSLSYEQINLTYQAGLGNHSVHKIVSNETTKGDSWTVAVTPNDRYEDGTTVVSAALTIPSAAPTVILQNPNSSWVTFSDPSFECKATSVDVNMDNVSLWTNKSGTWAHYLLNDSVSGKIPEVLFNTSGFTAGHYIWSCYACDVDGVCGFGENRTFIVDLTKPNITFVDPTPGNNTLRVIGSSGVTVNVTSSDSGSNGNHSVFVDWNRSLVGWWSFDSVSGTTVYDNSTYTNNGTITGGPYVVEGKFGKGLRFDGDDDYVIKNSFAGASTDKITLSVWFFPYNYSSYDGILMYGVDPFSNQNYLAIAMRNFATQLVLYTRTSSSDYHYYYIADASDLPLNNWHHLVVVWDGINKSAYLNGMASPLTDFMSGGSETNFSDINNDQEIQIGRYYSGSTGYNFNGTIDEVRIYSRALTAIEVNASFNANRVQYQKTFGNLSEGGTYFYRSYTIDEAGLVNKTLERQINVNNKPTVSNVILNATSANNYTSDNLTVWFTQSDADSDAVTNITDWRKSGTSIAFLNMPFDTNISTNLSGAVRDYSTYGNNGTLGGGNITLAPEWIQDGKIGGAYNFTGSERIEVKSVDFPSVISFETWFYLDTGASYRAIAGFEDPSTGKNSFSIMNDGRSLYITDNSYRYHNANISPKTWYHLVLIADQSDISNTAVWMNGVNTTINATVNGLEGSLDYLSIGRGESWTSTLVYFKGMIDQPKIYNGTLTEEQIKANYMAGLANHSIQTIVSEETSKGDSWTVAVTPNDRYEDGTTVVSAALTVPSTVPYVNLFNPNSSWVTPYDPYFTCVANSPDVDLTNVSLWTNKSGTWTFYQSSAVTGTNVKVRFNTSGFSGGHYIWTCEACDIDGYCSSADNKSFIVDLTVTALDFVYPTPGNASRIPTVDTVTINVSSSDIGGIGNHSVFLDWNRSLMGWWDFDWYNSSHVFDNSTYGHHVEFISGDVNASDITTGIRGKALEFNVTKGGLYLNNSNLTAVFDEGKEFSISLWFRIYDDKADVWGNLFHKDFPIWATPYFQVVIYHHTGDDYGTGYVAAYLKQNDSNTNYLSAGTLSSSVLPYEWYHFVMVVNLSAPTLKAYLNGALKQTDNTPAGNYTNWDTGIHLGHEEQSIPALSFNGSLDEVMIFSRALTLAEVRSLYNADIYSYERTFSDLSVGGTYQYRAYSIDGAANVNSTLERELTINNKPTVSSVVLNATSANNYTTDNLTLWFTQADSDSDAVTNITDWRLDGKSIALLNMPFDTNVSTITSGAVRDYSTYGHNGTLGGGVLANASSWNSSGSTGGFYDFDGYGDYIDLGRQTALEFYNQSFTISFSAKVDKSDRATVISNCFGTRHTGWDVYFRNPITIRLQGEFSEGAQDYADWTVGDSTTGFHHYVIIVNFSSGWTNAEVWQDGVSKGIASLSDGPTASDYTSDFKVRIGRGDTNLDLFNGSIDEILIFNRSLSVKQVYEVYNASLRNISLQTIVSDETSKADSWTVSVTPNDGYEDGTTVVSATLTVASAAPIVILQNPNSSWVTFSDPSFECRATSVDASFDNVSLWTNKSGTWAHYLLNDSVSGTATPDVLFNTSGFSAGIYIWSCYACDVDGICGFGENRTFIVDLTKPNVTFVNPTPSNNTLRVIGSSGITVNVTSSDDGSNGNHSVFIDWNRTLVGWWSFDSTNGTTLVYDNSTYANNGTMNGDPQITEGYFGKGLDFDGDGDYIQIDDTSVGAMGTQDFSISFWIRHSVLPVGWYDTIISPGNGDSAPKWEENWVVGKHGDSEPQSKQNNMFFSIGKGTDNGYYTTTSSTKINDSNWHHIVAVADRDGMARLYIDGEFESSTDISGTVAGLTSTSGISIGRNNGGSFYLNGTLDEIHIYKRALTAAEVNASFDASRVQYQQLFANLSEGGTYFYRAYTIDEAGLVNKTLERQITVNNKPTVSNVILNATSSNNYTTDNLTVWFTQSDADSDAVTNITDWRKQGTSIAVLNLPFDTNISVNTTGAVRDYSTFGNNGTLGNTSSGTMPTWTSNGRSGGAYQFDGINDTIDLGTSSDLDAFGANRDFSISAWIRRNDTTNLEGIFSGSTGLFNTGIYFGTQWNDEDNLRFLSRSNTVDLNTTDNSIGDNDWHHVVLTVDRDQNGTIYVDGRKRSSTDISSTAAENWSRSAGIYKIGVDRQHSNFFNGTIDEVMIYNFSLSPEQINVSYQAGLANHSIQTIVSNETSKADSWTVAVTPNDGYEDGTTVVSAVLTVASAAPTVILQNPNSSWVTFSDPSFECRATSIDADMDNVSLWTNKSGTWAHYLLNDSVSGTATPDVLFNSSGFGAGHYIWSCYACDVDGICGFGENRSFTVDLTIPQVSFVNPTPANNTQRVIGSSGITINVTSSDSGSNGNNSVYVDWNRTLVGWWGFDHISGTTVYDNSTWTNNGTMTNGPYIVEGYYGKGIKFDGDNDHINISYGKSMNITDELTLSAWIKSNVNTSFVASREKLYAFDEKFEGSGYENSWSEIAGTGTLDEDADPADVSSPSGWGDQCFKVIAPNATLTSTSTTAFNESDSWIRFEFIITDGLAEFSTNSQNIIFLVSENGVDYIYGLLVYWNGSDVIFRLWDYQAGSPRTNRDTNIVVAEDTLYRAELKWDSTNDAYAIRINGVDQPNNIDSTYPITSEGTLTASHAIHANILSIGGRNWFGAVTNYYTAYFDRVSVDNTGWIGESSTAYALTTENGGEFIINNGTTFTANLSGDINDKQWHHLVGTYNGSLMNLYVDGELKSTNSSFSGSLPTDTSDLIIGASDDSNYFNGTIDEVQIYSRALTAAEINSSFNANRAQYQQNFTDLAEGGTYTYRAYTVDEAGLVNKTAERQITVNNIPTVSNVVLNSSSSNNITSDNLTLWFTQSDADPDNVTNITDWRKSGVSIALLNTPFDTNTSSTASGAIKDYSTFSNNGTLIATPVWVKDGKVGGAYRFNSSLNSYMTFADNGEWDNGGEITVSAWIKASYTGADGVGIVQHDNSEYKWLLYLSGANSSDTVSFYVRTASDTSLASCAFADGAVTDDEWHLLTGTFDRSLNSNRLKMYYDGYECDAVNAYDESITPGDEGVWVGRWSVNYFDGLIDEVQVFNHSMSKEQINITYLAGMANHSVQIMISNETSLDENWSVALTPNDATEDGTTVLSNNVTIINNVPTVSNVVIASTSGNNVTTDNLTVTFSQTDLDGEAVSNVTDWRIGGSSIAVLNMPFNTEVSTFTAGAVKSYSSTINNGTLGDGVSANKPTWTSSGKVGGAYSFNNDFINISADPVSDVSTNFSVSLWFSFPSTLAERGHLISDYHRTNNNGWIVQLLTDDTIAAGVVAESNVYKSSVTPSLNTGTWYHVFVNFYGNGDQHKVYLNGVENYTESNNGVVNQLYFGAESTKIGVQSFPSDERFFNGDLDEVIVFNREMSPEQIKRIYEAGIEKNSIYTIVSNETLLGENWSVSVTATDGSQDSQPANSTNLTILNSVPTAPSVNVTPENPTVDSDLYCNLTANSTDANNHPIQYTYLWYKNSTLNRSSGYTSASFDNLSRGNTTYGDVWNCTIIPYDGTGNGTAGSDVVTIANTPPSKVTLLIPTNANESLLDRTPYFDWINATDADGDSLSYQMEVFCPSCVVEINQSPINDSNYTAPSSLDLDKVYFWRVRANDTKDVGEWSDTWNFTILSTSIILINGTVSFGNIDPGTIDNTSDDSPEPFRVENNGNVDVNISIYATASLWTRSYAGLNTSYLQVAARNSSEDYSFDWARSNKTWVDVQALANKIQMIRFLNYTDSKDLAQLDVRISVPYDEPPGKANTTIVFEARQS